MIAYIHFSLHQRLTPATLLFSAPSLNIYFKYFCKMPNCMSKLLNFVITLKTNFRIPQVSFNWSSMTQLLLGLYN